MDVGPAAIVSRETVRASSSQSYRGSRGTKQAVQVPMSSSAYSVAQLRQRRDVAGILAPYSLTSSRALRLGRDWHLARRSRLPRLLRAGPSASLDASGAAARRSDVSIGRGSGS